MTTEDHIRGFLSRAGVAEGETSPTGVLSTESVLVFWGEWRHSLGIYDQNGSKIGHARRIKDRYSQVGYRSSRQWVAKRLFPPRSSRSTP
jgi:hypothetical protein